MFPLPPLEAALLGAVALAAITDLNYHKIPNALVLAGLGAALLLRLPGSPGAILPPWAGGALAGLLLFLPHYVLRGMAAGDVKLMAMVGAFAGPVLALQIALASLMIGGLIGLVMLLWRGRLRVALRNLRTLLLPWLLRAGGMPLQPVALAPGESVGGMPYGLAIALATWSLSLGKYY